MVNTRSRRGISYRAETGLRGAESVLVKWLLLILYQPSMEVHRRHFRYTWFAFPHGTAARLPAAITDRGSSHPPKERTIRRGFKPANKQVELEHDPNGSQLVILYRAEQQLTHHNRDQGHHLLDIAWWRIPTPTRRPRHSTPPSSCRESHWNPAPALFDPDPQDESHLVSTAEPCGASDDAFTAYVHQERHRAGDALWIHLESHSEPFDPKPCLRPSFGLDQETCCVMLYAHPDTLPRRGVWPLLHSTLIGVMNVI